MRVQVTRPTYAYNLRARLLRTIYALVLRVQSTHPTYVIRHVISLSLARTYYTSLFGAHVFIIESVPNSKLSSLFPENKTLNYFSNQDWLTWSPSPTFRLIHP